MKTFVFIFEDNKGNELQRKERICQNKKEAFKLANRILAESMINDLYMIKVKVK